jgi:hypothetical protein
MDAEIPALFPRLDPRYADINTNEYDKGLQHFAIDDNSPYESATNFAGI